MSFIPSVLTIISGMTANSPAQSALPHIIMRPSISSLKPIWMQLAARRSRIGRLPEGTTERTEVPATYVPARNLIFLSYALGYAERVGALHLYIGVNSVDYSGYPDCRPAFIKAFQAAADAATAVSAEHGQRIVVETPLQYLSKGEIIRRGTQLGVPYEMTTSCYRGEALACGTCDSCLLRLRGFAEAGRRDPISYLPHGEEV